MKRILAVVRSLHATLFPDRLAPLRDAWIERSLGDVRSRLHTHRHEPLTRECERQLFDRRSSRGRVPTPIGIRAAPPAPLEIPPRESQPVWRSPRRG